VAEEAARTAFPDAQAVELPNLDAALAGNKTAGLSLLILAGPSNADVAKATGALDSEGLPRWGVVLIHAGDSDPEAEAVAPEDWTPSLAGRVIRWCAEGQRARREAARLRGDLLTFGLRIAHDLRTPLGGISVSAETLKDALSADCPGDVPMVKPIFDSCDELAAMIRQVSVLAKATARPVPQERLSMGSAVWSALERLAASTKAAGASISVPKSWPEVLGDSVSLEAVWWNLVSNAIRHGGKHPRIELGWEALPGGHRFWVRDNGPGISDRNQKMLFQPFHRLHEANAARGLGLPIVQRLVQLLGGHCGYEAVSTGGSLFSFTLPHPAQTRR
jgi:signal transduction histidine kinase